MPDATGKMKQFATLFTHGVRNGGELRHAVHYSQTGAEIPNASKRFSHAPPPLPRIMNL